MSDYVVTSETYAAWRHIDSKSGSNPHERDWAEFARMHEELGLQFAELDQSPSVEKLENFFKLVLELERSVHESLARTMELYHSLNICVADIEARPEAFQGLGSEEANQRAMDRKNSVSEASCLLRWQEK
ncbi:hypothetical protein BJV78DRAFT_1284929 [Lactifluus subvellereus]|nr:hypothetical protein BJV78DRAFT_1284929 [Lactifluus subvellereus]